MQTSFLDTRQLSLLNGMDMPARSCEKGQQKDGSQDCTCGKGTSECLIHPNTPEKWIAYMQDSLANLLALPENAKALRMREENSSLKSFAVLKQYDPNMSFLKMSQDCSQANPHLAYVAGLIDGEGCLRIHRQSKKTTSTFTAIVQLNMSNKARVIGEQMAETFGGSLYEVKSPNPKWSDQWQWRISGDVASNFVMQIRPFLMLKRKQADLILQLHSLKESQPFQKNGAREWSQEAKEQAARIKDMMHMLNQKGPTAQGAAEGWYQTSPDLFGTWSRFSGPWPRSGMTRNGFAYELPIVGRITRGTDGGYSLPTPTVAMEAPNKNANTKGPKNLLEIAHGKWDQMWPTPTAHNAKECAAPSEAERNTPTLASAAGGKLNPMWVEWLMGFPIGFTDLKDWVTRKFPCRRRSPGSY